MQPLEGIRVVEFGGQAPAPFASLILADLGASIIRIDRPPSALEPASLDILHRGKRSIALNIKSPEGLSVARQLVAKADVVIDPFRPGVLEKLGLGPGDVMVAGGNERVIYGRLAGFSQSGDQKNMAGHDLNYLSSSGLLSMMPHKGPSGSGTPSFPSNLVADFAGGGLMLALKILAALQERTRTGKGQVILHDMVNGSRYVGSFLLLNESWPETPYFGHPTGENMLDGGAPYYGTYRCSDGGFVAVACIEPKFYAQFLKLFLSSLPSPLQTDARATHKQDDREKWAVMKEFITEGFMTRSRDEWATLFHGTDACVTPVLTPAEAASKSTSAIPTLFPDSPKPDASTPPTLGNGTHTAEILAELECEEELKTKVLAGYTSAVKAAL